MCAVALELPEDGHSNNVSDSFRYSAHSDQGAQVLPHLILAVLRVIHYLKTFFPTFWHILHVLNHF
jgi:hypothetical protein